MSGIDLGAFVPAALAPEFRPEVLHEVIGQELGAKLNGAHIVDEIWQNK